MRQIDDADLLGINVLHDSNNPKIVKGELFHDIIAFRKAIRHYAVKRSFEFALGLRQTRQGSLLSMLSQVVLDGYMLPPYI